MDKIFLYGPPGSGKTAVGSRLGQDLGCAFLDLDEEITRWAGKSIPEIFSQAGEGGFRSLEAQLLQSIIAGEEKVIALGGGALLDRKSRALVESIGQVVLLSASPDILQERIQQSDISRPLLTGGPPDALSSLLGVRREHYASFPLSIDSGGLTPAQVSWRIQVEVGWFYIRGMGVPYTVRVANGLLKQAGGWARDNGLAGPLALVTDENVGRYYRQPAKTAFEAAGYALVEAELPPGEATKSIRTAGELWRTFLEGGLDRGSTVVAIGGGMVSDLAGFAASTYMRGIPWIALPTSMLGMVDASLGGKTGLDLPQGKNLVGTFHPPTLVLADPLTLETLPTAEMRAGLAEVVKAGVIADPELFERCRRDLAEFAMDLGILIRRAMAVKIQTIQADPYERGLRATLNFGHTIGHGVESASEYQLRHGEAVAIGMVAETRLAEAIGIAHPGLSDEIAEVLQKVGLPVEIPRSIDRSLVLGHMQADKKKRNRRLRFALPEKIGQVRVGVGVDEADLARIMVAADTG